MSKVQATWLIAVCAAGIAAGEGPWAGKPVSSWTEEDARKVLTDSPWARTVRLTVAHVETEDERREGGNMGQPHGIGYDGLADDRPREKLPTGIVDIVKPGDYDAHSGNVYLSVTLRWETALPVRVAELKARILPPPGSDSTAGESGYTMAVYGVPNANKLSGDSKKLGAPFREFAALKRPGKRDVKPSSVEVFQTEAGLVIIFRFPASAEITTADGRVEFDAKIGRVIIVQPFNLEQMQFQGRLEL